MTRQDLISRLVGLDANGIWTDADSVAEGYEPLTLTGAIVAYCRLADRERRYV